MDGTIRHPGVALGTVARPPTIREPRDMPLSRFDEFLAHQTSDTFDHVATSDRNFYDRYYFNMHASSDEIFVITGLGQYPNLGVTDAFITVSLGTKQYTVRSSRELGGDRMDTSVGPLSVEVIEGLQKL